MGRPRKNANQAKDTPNKTKVPEEDTENLSLTLTRSRRIPKPNPKYSNDVIVSFSSKDAGDSSRSTSPARSETSEEIVPMSEDDDEEEVEAPKPGTRKRGRPPKNKIPEPPKKISSLTPQSKDVKMLKKKEGNEPVKRTPERQGKQLSSPDIAAKRKKDDNTIATVDASVKKDIKALEEKLKNISKPKVLPQTRSNDKKISIIKGGSPVKGEYIDIEGTAENVKIVDVSEILSKKHEVLVNEPKRLRKCPPEAHKIPPRTPYGSKILSQSPKVGSQTPKVLAQSPKVVTSPQKGLPKLPSVASRMSQKISPKSTPPPPLITRHANNGKVSSVSSLSDAKKSLTTSPKCTVIDLTEGANSLEKPKKALKEALVASAGARKRPEPVSSHLMSTVQKKSSDAKSPLINRTSSATRPPPLITRPPPLITRGLTTKSKISDTPHKRDVMSIELWNVVHLPRESVEELPKITLGMTLKDLTEKIKEIQLPSEAWSHNVNEDTEPSSSITFKLTKPTDPSKERSVTFSATELIIEIEGNEVVFVGAPASLSTPSDIQTLLEIVNDVSMKNSCVETVAVVL
ncbi:titin-like [Lutzomyia longipalpis]|uniref:titin-like n=1 Tax=Lutzomyia longipalpis TaxID=7200 RepID=UPI0024842F69|nr:titin-like [Lutzomyia longipalpis]